MSPRRHVSRATKSRTRLRKFLAWLRLHPRLIGGWTVALGLLLVTFPTVYRTIVNQPSSRLLSQATTISNLLPSTPALPAGRPGVERGQKSDEPIRIDPTLLGFVEPSQPPLRIVIPSRSIDLPVVEAPVVNGYWELSETTASHGVGSANPGQIGNTVIFAHARKNLFLPLRDVKKDESVYVLTKDRWFRYRVTETKLVHPKDVEVIKPTDDETLTLFTCSGFLDTKRLIVIAKPLRP